MDTSMTSGFQHNESAPATLTPPETISGETTIVDVIQKLSLAKDIETVMFIVRKAARKFAQADGATFVLKKEDKCFYAAEDAIAPLWTGKEFPMSICVSGWVIMNKKAVVIEDIFLDDRVPLEAYRPTFVKSLAMVPIRSEEPIGAIGVYWSEPHRPTPDQLNLLASLADSTSVAMENILLQQQLKEGGEEQISQLEIATKLIDANKKLENMLIELNKRQEEMKLLKELTSRLQTCVGISEAYQIIEQELRRLLPKSSGQLYMMHNSRNYFEVMAKWGDSAQVSSSILKPDDCLALRSCVATKPLKTQCAHYHDETEHLVCSCMPLAAQSNILGLLCLEWGHETDQVVELENEEFLLSSMISEQLSIGLSNIKLRETLRNQSVRDTLTGLYNRRYIEECLEREAQRCKRNKTSLAVMMIDIDHFKRFNDMYGHGAGDAVIVEISNSFNDLIRTGSDIASRYGGEEFMLALPEISLKDATKRAEKLCREVAERKVFYNGTPLRTITISVGLALFPEDAEKINDLIEAADKALYIAKNSGRNRVVLYKSTL